MMVLLTPIVFAGDWVRPITEAVSNLWTLSGSNIYYDAGNVTIGGTSSDGLFGIVSGGSTTTMTIDNAQLVGDAELKFQLSSVTKMTTGIRDSGSGDPFQFNYADGLDSSPEFSITTDDVLVGDASFVFDNKVDASICDVTPSVDEMNFFKTVASVNCTYRDFDDGEVGQILVIVCAREQYLSVVEVVDNFRVIDLDGGVTFDCSGGGGNTLTLIQSDGGTWYELSRSING